ncbi:MAG: response regulator transcription factor [Clostridiales bacterium]|nr:response regulator transcription factor [Candidatus Coliplasma caballi]
MISIAICDDRESHLDRISRMLRQIILAKVPDKYDCRVCGEFRSADKVAEYLKTNTINILFLDIEMEGTSGFELAASLGREFPEIIVLFVSSYDDYVYSSFAYSPFRFLRKTHLEEELEPALLAAIRKLMSQDKTLEFNTADGHVETRLRDILYFECQHNYLIAHLNGGEAYRFRSTVAAIIEQTRGNDFYRIHQGYVINLANVKRLKGYSSVVMINDVSLPISSRNVTGFKKAYMEFVGRRIIPSKSISSRIPKKN